MSEELKSEVATVYREYNGGYVRTLISPGQSGGALALMEMVLPQGAEPPMHLHADEDEAFYLLSGEMFFQIDGKEIHVKAGDAVFAPRKVPHLFKILSREVRFLTLISPGNFWEYFIEFSKPCIGEPVVTPPQGPPSTEFIAHLTKRMTLSYGITIF
ncbi:quercetin dioxygenase-like cupin family protein [Arcticibacter tournemirensis]|uniref:Cupin domain-containing protein n=1 Tax=Arcticibacter tournemirensis TaxID=699437 RepID=A0A5M9HCL1_9SPHI|nr:cupin domain-containing protein [Arcticibacter tournemirensis]KAA8484065.1 cupin domain-containing protein [Arcticibacter tournemirensis]TQM51799.1 quercetin dioxygenase-like cupin family protein [Arcticibacter tournemirensis]